MSSLADLERMQEDKLYNSFIAITKSDDTDLAILGIKGIYVGGTGDVIVKGVNSAEDAVTFKAVPVGTVLPIRVSRVMAATTATLLIGLK